MQVWRVSQRRSENRVARAVTHLVQREQAGNALSHFFLVRVHFSQALCARSGSIGDSEPREDDTERDIMVLLLGSVVADM